MEEGSLEDSFCDEERDSFMQPPTRSLRFALRKRKRRIGSKSEDPDSVSVCSLDLDTVDQPETKKKKLPRVTSLASVFSTPLGKMSSALHKSLSSARLGSPAGSLRTPSTASLARSASTMFENQDNKSGRTSPGSVSLQESAWPGSPFRRSSVNLTRKSSTSNLTPYKLPAPTPTKSRPTRYWSSIYADQCHKLSQKEIKLQEAIYEIYNGEDDLIEDLKLVRKTYADSMIHLNILKAEEERLVFGQLDSLTPLHAALHAGLKKVQCKDGFWFEIGAVITPWVKTLEKPYVNYCSNLIQAKEFLDNKKESDKAFNDFLQRCLESPFSRKLDLWSYLDVPRSRLVKYPLLLKQVIKYSDETDDIKLLQASLQVLEKAIEKVDRAMAETRCTGSISKMEFLSSTLPAAVASAKEEILSGVLRNSRGTKVYVSLMDTVLVVGRCVTRPGIGKVIQVYRDPIPLVCLGCLDITDGEAVKPGSFHRAFTNQAHNRNAFKVYWTTDDEEGSSHTLVAPDEHTKRQWVTVIQKAVSKLDRTDLAAKVQELPAKPTTPVSTTPTMSMSKVAKKLTLSTSGLAAPSLSRSRGAGSVGSTPRLLSAASLNSPNLRRGIFKKNKTSPNSRLAKTSPVIKSSLSQSALVKLQSGGVKKLRVKGTKGRQDENKHRGAIVLDGNVLQGRRAKSAISLTGGKKKAPAEKRMLALIDENSRQRTKSWNNLLFSPTNHRYMTRRTTKMSKSMNDLLAL